MNESIVLPTPSTPRLAEARRSLLPFVPPWTPVVPPWTPQVERGADMVGEVLGGRFVVTGRIGRGGM
ncbi:MAG TPA: hypothetical protein PKW35_18980, partial [Nannocystaceae bacterium]|nr:hypothetical protein [Nannocystaceae bacterium]